MPDSLSEALQTHAAPPRRWPPPWVFVFLPLPFGVFTGYVQIALPWLLRRMGHPVDGIGAMVALVLSPMAFAFLWSPLADFGLRRRTWTVLMSAVSGLLLGLAILLLGNHPRLAMWLLFAGYSVALFTTSCTGGLLAATLEDPEKSRAAAWMQGGVLTAAALGGALLLWCSRELSLPLLALAAFGIVAGPAVIALTIPEGPPRSDLGNLVATCSTMVREIRSTLLSWKSLPGLLLLFSPVGSGAAQSLFAAMARDYGVGMHGVLLLNGVAGGILNMIGAYAAVIVPAHWDRRIAYAGAGLACAASGLFLTFAPFNPFAYYAGVAMYMLTTGACFGFFLGVVMVTMGEAGLSASCRYAILVSLGDLPIVYMTVVEGWSYRLFGARGVPASDAIGNLAVALGVAVWLGFRSRKPAVPAAAREPIFACAISPAVQEVAGCLPLEPVAQLDN